MPPPDRAALAVFVQDFTDATGLGVTSEPFCFGDSAQLADELAALVRCGRKRATATTVVELEQAGEPLATIGQLSVVYDGAGQPVCVIRTEQLSVGSPDDVLDPAFAWDDGEGDRTYEDWLAAFGVLAAGAAEGRRRVQPGPARGARAVLSPLAAAGRSGGTGGARGRVSAPGLD